MNTKSLTYLITGAGLLLAASPLMAAVVDNINVPTTPGEHAYFGSITGDRALDVGNTISGSGVISGIVGRGSNSLCASGSSCTLEYSFGGYTLANITDGGTTAFFTGGQVSFTANDSDTFLTAEADALSPDPTTIVDDTQYTLKATKATGNAQNGAFGLLSVTGGDAFSLLNNNSFANGEGGFSDLLFNTSWSPFGEKFGGSSDIHYQVSATPVPEPSELGLLVLGLALIGGGLAFRRRKNT